MLGQFLSQWSLKRFVLKFPFVPPLLDSLPLTFDASLTCTLLLSCLCFCDHLVTVEQMLSVYKQMLGGQVDYRQDLSHFIEGRLDRLYPKALSIMKFHNLVIFFTPVTQNVKPIGAFAFSFLKPQIYSLSLGSFEGQGSLWSK